MLPSSPPYYLPSTFHPPSNILPPLYQATRLLSAKAEIELEFTEYIAKFNQDKWAKVQKAMEAKGTTDKYPSLFLQKKFEELSAAGVVASAAADDTEMAEGESAEEEENGEEEEAVKAEE